MSESGLLIREAEYGKNKRETPEELYEQLIKTIRKYHPSEDISLVEKAYETARKGHEKQIRKSGEPYIIHPLSVAIILAELEMDKETIAAGMLHDVVEDTDISLETITNEFSVEVAELVDGVTKLTKIKYTTDKIDLQAENLRKMFLAMAKDIRVVIIKLADRLHNMRTLQYMTRYKQIEKAHETMEIYAPIAQRLGISKIKIELDDMALKYSKPDVYYDLIQSVEVRKQQREVFIDEIIDEVKDLLAKAEIKCEVGGRVKHFFSIYKKMINQNKGIDEIYDLFAIRIYVDSVKDCYAALGVVHDEYKPIPGRFKDYIAMPKPNMYQSLHTTLISHTGEPFEVQIRTYEMHKTAEYGIAAHWKYKEGESGKKAMTASEEEKLSWLRQILDWQQDASDNKEFLDFLKTDLDLFSDSVFCFTPQGDVKNLPAGSTPIDFAYSIHSAVGNKMIGARVNDKIVNIDYQIKNGDRIEIITSQNSSGPSMDWLKIVKSSQAKNKISQWFRNAHKEDNILKGKEMVERYLKAHNINCPQMFTPEYINVILPRYSCKDWDAVLASIGHGGIKEGHVINRLYDEYCKKNKVNEPTDEDILSNAEEASQVKSSESRYKNGIVVKGLHDVAVRFAKCCSPVPGDEVVGFITRGRGVTVHRTDCINMVNISPVDKGRLIDVSWDKLSNAFVNEKYIVEINIFATNRPGMIVEISKIMATRDIDIRSMNVRVSKQGTATVAMGFETSSTDELQKIMEKIKAIDGVIEVERSRG